jgi:ribosomal protein S14
VLAGLTGVPGATAALDLFYWHTFLLLPFPVSVTCALMFAVRVNARTIANFELAERAKRRPDYGHIARMEREIYGEAFDHDGAPGVAGLWPLNLPGGEAKSYPVASRGELADAMAELIWDGKRKVAVARQRRPCSRCGYPTPLLGDGLCGTCYRQIKMGRRS